jgi:shikimate kinase
MEQVLLRDNIEYKLVRRSSGCELAVAFIKAGETVDVEDMEMVSVERESTVFTSVGVIRLPYPRRSGP